MSRIGRWWRKHSHVEPAIQPEPPRRFEDILADHDAKDADDLWITLCAQAPNCGTNGETFDSPVPVYSGENLRFSLKSSEFNVPVRDGKPATIYTWTDPTNPNRSVQFTDPEQVDEIIQGIRDYHHQQIKRKTAPLKKLKQNLS